VRQLAAKIVEYGKRCHDPYIDHAGIKSGLQAATTGTDGNSGE
jgi:hypothetical protein